MKKIPLHLQLFTIFCNYAKSGDYMGEWWLGFLQKIRTVGITHIEYMPYIIEKDGFYNILQPFKKVHGNYDLAHWKPQYWKMLKNFLKMTNKVGIKMIPVVFSKYSEAPFRTTANINNARGLWAGDSLKYEKRFIRKLMRITDRSQKGKPWVRLSNEISHGGNHYFGGMIAQHHEAWYEAIKRYVPLENVKSDITFCDFVMLAEKHHLLTNGKMPRASYYLGDGSNIRISWGKDKYDRINWAQVHGMPQRLPVESHGKTWREHISKHTSIKKWDLSTDGCTEGSGYKLVGTPFRNMNAEEIKKFAKEVWGYSGKKVIISELPKEVFFRDKDGIVADDMSLLDFSRLVAYAEAWEELNE